MNDDQGAADIDSNGLGSVSKYAKSAFERNRKHRWDKTMWNMVHRVPEWSA